MIWLSTEYFHRMGICTFLDVGAGMVPTNSRSMSQSRTWELSVFSHTFSAIWEFAHRVVWELHGFLLHKKYLRTHNFGMFVFSPYFFHTMGIHSSHALEIAWISALHEIFKKPLPYLPWFAIFFSTHWVCTFSILEKMNSNSKEKNIGKIFCRFLRV